VLVANSGAATVSTLLNSTAQASLIGGTGNDTYVIHNALDKIVENSGGGTDSVQTDLSMITLPDNVESLTYTGSGSASVFIANGSHTLAATNISTFQMENSVLATQNVLTLSNPASNASVFGTTRIDDTLNLATGSNSVTVSGVDSIIGGTGADTITVNSGSVTFSGGGGADVIKLNSGTDVIHYGATSEIGGGATINNFTHLTDKIDFTGSAFGSLGAGNLAEALGTDSGGHAVTGSHFVYDGASGTLYFNSAADNITAHSTAIATIHSDSGATSANLSAADIHIS
ncbi:MAG: hypothetical protein HY055_11860, partial [Magnetospirillum sp.]|nr:hypothetical protein [Magnetospirillum sp.]